MNKERRKRIEAVKTRLENEVRDKLDGLPELLSELAQEVEDIHDEEQDYLDNMPEGLRAGDKGSAAEDAVSSLNDAFQNIQAIADALDNFDIDDVAADLDTAAE